MRLSLPSRKQRLNIQLSFAAFTVRILNSFKLGHYRNLCTGSATVLGFTNCGEREDIRPDEVIDIQRASQFSRDE
jgi:hypothetical protein